MMCRDIVDTLERDPGGGVAEAFLSPPYTWSASSGA
jgi:hypothetical protein